jgi:hypothetical protein
VAHQSTTDDAQLLDLRHCLSVVATLVEHRQASD